MLQMEALKLKGQDLLSLPQSLLGDEPTTWQSWNAGKPFRVLGKRGGSARAPHPSPAHLCLSPAGTSWPSSTGTCLWKSA